MSAGMRSNYRAAADAGASVRGLRSFHPAVAAPAAAGIHEVMAIAVRGHRERLGVTQEQLARQLNWPSSRVIRVEKGAARVLLLDIPELCGVFGVTLRELLTGADPRALASMGLNDHVTTGPLTLEKPRRSKNADGLPETRAGADDGQPVGGTTGKH